MAKGQGRKKGTVPTFIERRKRKKTNLHKVDTTQCKKCLYRPPEYGENFLPFGCYYIILTGNRRPSDPSPNCTAFEPYNHKERRKLNKKLRDDFVKELFNNG